MGICVFRKMLVGAVSSVLRCSPVCGVAVSARCTVDGTWYCSDVQVALIFQRPLHLAIDLNSCADEVAAR